MTEKEFLSELERRLAGLPEETVSGSLEYYREMIGDMIEDGMTEEEAAASIGSVEEVASQIIIDTPLPKLVGAKMRPSRTLRAWEIALLIIGFPLWGSLLLAAVMLILSAYIVLWSAVVVVYSVTVSFAAGAVAGFAGGAALLFDGGGIPALAYAGIGFICAGAAILSFFLSGAVGKIMIKLSRMIITEIKSVFIGKNKEA